MFTSFLSHEHPEVILDGKTLAEQAGPAFQAAVTAAGPAARVLRVQFPVGAFSPLAWLAAQAHPQRTYWADREGAFETAGVGQADVVSGDRAPNLDALVARLSAITTPLYPDLRYYGGLQFGTPITDASPWSSLGAYRFVIPQFEMLRREGTTYFACTILAREGRPLQEQIEEVLSELTRLPVNMEVDSAARLEPPLLRRDQPDHRGWLAMVRRALAMLEHGEGEKVVLARQSLFEFAAPVDPLALLARLAEATPGSYHFCFQPAAGTAFIGASPERLYARQERRLCSEALAGTRPRGATPALDEALGADLVGSDKDRREHRFVVEALREAFAGLCRSIDPVDEVSLLKLQSCQHLYCAVSGALSDAVSDADILGALHPTPAVGGYPTDAAVAMIAQLEPFERGWYTGPVGWIGSEAAEFAVAIRCGLVHDAHLALYSGAGILAGSVPSDEWDEIENKMGSFVHVLTDHAD